MSGVECVELLFGVELVQIFVENDAYGWMIQDIRAKYKEQGVDFPIVNLREDLRLSGKQYQVLVNRELVFDGEIEEITENTMLEMIGQVSVSFCEYYNQYVDNDQCVG